jgi:hypothetical protein
VRSLQSAACGGILSAARTRLFKFHLRLWFVITLYSCGTDPGAHVINAFGFAFKTGCDSITRN